MSKRSGPPVSADRLTVTGAEDLVRAVGGRMTEVKREMLRILHRAKSPLSAEALLVKLGQGDEATVYRNLAQFEEAGVIVHSHHAHGPSVYRWASNRVVPVVCENCGETVELDSSLFEKVAKKLNDEDGFMLDIGHFALTGLCADCR